MPLSSEQERVALILLSAGAGRLVLGGGGALIAHGLVDRPSDDLDAFADSVEDFEAVVAAARQGLAGAGYAIDTDPAGLGDDESEIRTWLVARSRSSTVGRRPPVVRVQLVRDPIVLPTRSTRYGPALDPLELGANKILAIYDRSRARDYDDLARVAGALNLDTMLEVADGKQVERLDRQMLAHQFRNVDRVPPEDFRPEVDLDQLRDWCHRVADAVESGLPLAAMTPPAYAQAPPGS
jgi:hypothetical protein